MVTQLQNSHAILKLNQVKEKTGHSKSVIYALILANEFPKQIQLTSKRSVGWLASEINDYIQSRIDASRNVVNGGVK